MAPPAMAGAAAADRERPKGLGCATTPAFFYATLSCGRWSCGVSGVASPRNMRSICSRLNNTRRTPGTRTVGSSPAATARRRLGSLTPSLAAAERTSSVPELDRSLLTATPLHHSGTQKSAPMLTIAPLLRTGWERGSCRIGTRPGGENPVYFAFLWGSVVNFRPVIAANVGSVTITAAVAAGRARVSHRGRKRKPPGEIPVAQRSILRTGACCPSRRHTETPPHIPHTICQICTTKHTKRLKLAPSRMRYNGHNAEQRG
jgi:hypothetical protein